MKPTPAWRRYLRLLRSNIDADVVNMSPRTSSVPIIAVSALSRSQEREAALHAGCDAYLTKPFTPDDLARLVTTTLQGHGVAAS